MTIVTFLSAFILSYGVFMVFVFLMAKMIFTNVDKVEEQQQREKLLQMMKAKRVKKVHRVMQEKLSLAFKH